METLPGNGVDALPGLGAFFGLSLLCGLVLYIYFCFMLMKIANRTQTPDGWMAWIPILNFVLMCRIAGRPSWWVILMLIPFVNLIAFIVIWMGIAVACGKDSWIGLLIIVPVVGLLMPAYLAFSGGLGVAPSARPKAPVASPPARSATGCAACGAGVDPGDSFCGSCGQAIPQTVPAAPSTPSSGPRLVLALVAVAAIVGMAAIGFLGYRMLSRAAASAASGFELENPTADNKSRIRSPPPATRRTATSTTTDRSTRPCRPMPNRRISGSRNLPGHRGRFLRRRSAAHWCAEFHRRSRLRGRDRARRPAGLPRIQWRIVRHQ